MRMNLCSIVKQKYRITICFVSYITLVKSIESVWDFYQDEMKL